MVNINMKGLLPKGERHALLSESTEYVYGGKDYDEVDPVTLTWKNINVFAPVEEKKSFFSFKKSAKPQPAKETGKQILHDVNGIATPGTLLAIMGASGAGKTTLLNVLTGRSSHRLVTQGEVRVNGRVMGDDIKYTSAFVQQEDHFIPSLTVQEHLWFQASLRLDQEMPEKLKKRRVEDAISELNMKDLVNTRIGRPGDGRGLSGGERKRLTFASEVLTNPPLMFCDEPTSGLDSYMAQTIMETLRNLAARGRTILCTIHQPSSEVYAFMDRLCLMAEGRVAYIGTTESVDRFFDSVGYKCPMNYNPPDFFIHTLAIVPDREHVCRRRVQTICDEYKQTINYAETHRQIERLSDSDAFIIEMSKAQEKYSRSDDQSSSKKVLSYKASWWTQFTLLLWRCWTNNVRNPAVFRARVLQMVVIAAIMAFVFQDQTLNQKGVQNINGALFVLQIQFSTVNTNMVINGITRELDLFFREHHNGIYRVDTYFITFVLVELVSFVAIPVLYGLIFYWSIGLYTSPETTAIFFGALVLLSLTAMAFGHVLSTASNNITVALVLGPAIINPLSTFGGFLINVDSIAPFLKPLEYVSWFRYTYEILLCNQWKNVDDILCEIAPPIYAAPGNRTVVGYDTSVCYKDGQSVIENYNFNPDNIALDFGILFLLFIGFEVIAYTFLYSYSKKKQ